MKKILLVLLFGVFGFSITKASDDLIAGIEANCRVYQFNGTKIIDPKDIEFIFYADKAIQIPNKTADENEVYELPYYGKANGFIYYKADNKLVGIKPLGSNFIGSRYKILIRYYEGYKQVKKEAGACFATKD